MDQPAALTLTTAIRAYLEARRLNGYSPRTLYSYRRQLQHLAESLRGETLVGQIWLDHLRTYLSSFTHLKMSSLANRVRVVKVFFKWLHEEETLLRNPAVKLKEPRLPQRIPKALSVEEVELLRHNLASMDVSFAPEQLRALSEASAPHSAPFFTDGLKRVVFGGADVKGWR